MDWGSVAGLTLALGAILLGQGLDGGHFGWLVQPAALIIVGGATTGAVLLQSGHRCFLRGVRMVRWVFSPPVENHRAQLRDITAWSGVARREGLLSLERYMLAAHDPFTAKGLRLIVDGVEPNLLREILEIDISSYENEQRLAIKVWEAAGGYAPTIGILGAVLGLIQVMENLSDPGRLGNGIAVAFVSTVYGVGLANLVFLPIGNKLKALLNREIMMREMLTDVFAGIAAGDKPRVIEERLSSYRR
ncbi:flagellar motor protein [Polaromonas sp. AET17H-212]|uniref:flagellar motor protein n=1 Tax=Polaromonas sp. AET17H-212 TaxID=1977061 RepID=UPI000BBCEE70|nr:flagellar motor protein [Polaromonas sp. AET17H-212]